MHNWHATQRSYMGVCVRSDPFASSEFSTHDLKETSVDHRSERHALDCTCI